MWISVLLLIVCSSVTAVLANGIDGCQILQTTDPRTPCYILIKQAPNGVPPFVYMLNLPRSYPQTPCPVSQSLDSSSTCYVSPRTPDDPAFILNIPLPPGADEIDDSPAGKAKLREAKANPIFRKVGTPSGFGPQIGFPQQVGSLQPKELPRESTQFIRQPQPDPIGAHPIGPSSPQLTKAIFKPLTPSIPQIQPPSPQNPIVFRTVPTLFNPQLTQTGFVYPGTKTFHQIRYQNQQPLYYASFIQPSQKDPFPYSSSEGRGSINAFQGPYPPRY